MEEEGLIPRVDGMGDEVEPVRECEDEEDPDVAGWRRRRRKTEEEELEEVSSSFVLLAAAAGDGRCC